MAISITQTNSTNTTENLPKKRCVYDNYDKLTSVVHYDVNNQVDFVLKGTNNPTGKSLETKKFQQVHVDVVQAPTDISFDRVTLRARIYKNDNSTVSETGFIVWESNNNSDDSVLTKQKFSNTITPIVLKGNFSKQILNLLENKTYNYRAYVTHEYGTNYSKVYQFNTIPFSSIFSIAGTPTSGPAPLTVNLTGINAGTGVTSYAWNMTGGPISFQYSVSSINVTNAGTGYEPDLARYSLSSIQINLSGAGYNPAAKTLVLVNGAVQNTLSANFTYNNVLTAYGISSVQVPAEILGYTTSTLTITFSTSDNSTITQQASGIGVGNSYTIPREVSVLINNTVQPLITANIGYNDETDTYGVSSVTVLAEVFGFTNSSRTVSFSSNAPVQTQATATASGNIQAIADYTTQAITHTYLSAGTFNPIVYAINGDQIVKQATREIRATGGGGANYSADWTAIRSSSYGNNIVGAYDFRNVPNSSLKNGLLAFWKLDNLTDSSGNNRTLTNNGNVQFVAGKIGNAATGNASNYLNSSLPINLSNQAYTFSFWLKLNSFNQAIVIIGKYPGLSVNIQSPQNRVLRVDDFTQASSYVSVSALPLNEWVHVALIIDNNNITLYLNGELDAGTGTANTYNTTGIELFSSFSWHNWSGQLDAFGIWNRVLTEEEIGLLYNDGVGTESIGTTVDAIVGPDLNLVGNTVIETDGDPYYNNVSLLLHMDGTNGSTVFVDSSTNSYSITAVNSAQISTSIKKYGSGSGHFPSGSNNKLSISVNTPLANFGTGDFTIEWWEYLTTTSGNIGIFCYGGEGQSGGSDQPVIGLRYESDSFLRVGYNRGTDNDVWVDFNMSGFNSQDRLVTNQWVHCALVRQSGSLRFYRNGNVNSTVRSFNHNLPNASTINYPKNSTIGSFNGTSRGQYIDDLRITKGVARYIANFTPPAAALPDVAGNNIGVTFTPSPAYAVANQTITVTYPHTLVYVGKINAASAPAETVILATQPNLNGFNGNQVNMVFARPFQSLMPYNGNDNQQSSYLPNGSEWFLAAFSFLSNNTVRYAIRSSTKTLNGVVNGSSSKQNYNGFVTFGAGFGNLPQYNVFGTVRLGMFINDDFSTVEEMNTLFAQITAGPANGLL